MDLDLFICRQQLNSNIRKAVPEKETAGTRVYAQVEAYYDMVDPGFELWWEERDFIFSISVQTNPRAQPASH
jgi:hypothetical protein